LKVLPPKKPLGTLSSVSKMEIKPKPPKIITNLSMPTLHFLPRTPLGRVYRKVSVLKLEDENQNGS
jgi:hypothetical protein